ncbi:DUF4129 domain-containing protein [Nocardioides sp.]|uniref:DUF4129 domain-containing protein n=1 Tax=Nocardioides sp. TaxID=35761 RepID=UPI003528B195
MILPLSEPPLTPSPDQARLWLRRELVNPEYQRESPLARAWAWIQDALARAAEGAASVGPLVTLLSLLVFALLAVALGLLVARARTNRRAARAERPVLDDPAVTAAELRRRARAAFADQRWDDAVVDGFRAVAAGQVERGRLDDLPAATAHEVAAVLEQQFPRRHDEVARAAYLFDLVLYGDRRATQEQAAAVLALDDELVAGR